MLVSLASNLKQCQLFIRKYFGSIVRLPSDWLDIAATFLMLPDRYLKGDISIPTALRKAMVAKFTQFDQYQLAKYNKEKSIKKKAKKNKNKKEETTTATVTTPGVKPTLTMKQMIRQLHISTPILHTMSILGKKYPKTEEEYRASKLPGEFDINKAGKRMKLPVPETWETFLSAKGNKASTWEELIEMKKLPFMAMLRNIRNLIFTGVHPKYHRWVINKLTNENSIASSRQFPTQFFSAYEIIPKDLNDFKLKLQEQNKPKEKEGKKLRAKKAIVPAYMPSSTLFDEYRAAIDQAVKLATKNNVKPIKGTTIVFCNVSKEMKNDCSSARNLGALKKLDEVGILLGLMCKYICEDSEFLIFGPKTTKNTSYLPVELQEGTILDNMKIVKELANNEFGNSNDKSEFPFEYLEQLVLKNKKIDNLIILSHTLIANESINNDNSNNLNVILNKYRRQVNSELLFVSVDLTGKGATSGNEENKKHINDVYISGFSDSILRFIAERGDTDQLQYVENIDVARKLRNPNTPKEITQSHLEELDKLNSNDNSTNNYKRNNKNKQENKKEEEMDEYKVPEWKTARIFISSTFLDMHGERDVLTRYVFPELRERCKKHLIHLAEVDLRWGVTEQEAQQNKSLEICLSEVQKCSPFFLSLLGSRYGWCPDYKSLLNDNNNTKDGLSFEWLKEYPEGRSITELEIAQIQLIKEAKPLFYIRDNSVNNTIPPEYKSSFHSENKQAEQNIEILKEKIKKGEGNKVRVYKCTWGGVFENKPMMKGLDTFRKYVLNDLWQTICNQFNIKDEIIENDITKEIDNIIVQRSYHVNCMNTHIRKFIQRKELEDLHKHVIQHNTIVIHGKEGTGKSALVAKFAHEFSLKFPSVFVLTHFIGVGPGSNDIRQILQRICFELIRKFKLNTEENNNDNIPDEFNELCQYFINIVEQASFKGRIVIIIDAIDQLNKTNRAHSLDWLPKILPVKLIVTTIDGPLVDLLKRRNIKEIVIGSLSVKERKDLVRQTLLEYNKKLDERPMNDQMRLLLKKTDADKPLYLIVACNELRLFGIFEQLTDKLKTLSQTTSKLFEEVLVRLELDYGKEIIKTIMTIIACSRIGIIEDDLLVLLKRKEKQETMLPLVIWSSIYSGIHSLLRITITNDGALQYDFFHKEVTKAVQKRYLDFDQEQEIKTHKLLAEYYYGKADPEYNNTWQSNDNKAISELPYHLTKAKLWKPLEKTLSSLVFIEKKCSIGMTSDLINDYILATDDSTLWKGYERGKETIIEFSKFVRTNGHILQNKSQLTYQQAANEPDNTSPARMARALISTNTLNKFWIKWQNKPQKSNPCKMTIKTTTNITTGTMSPDSTLLLLATKDYTIRIYNVTNGIEVGSLIGHSSFITSCCYSNDQSKIISSDSNGIIIVWDTYLNVEQSVIKEHNRHVNQVQFSSDGKKFASGSWDCTVKIFDNNDNKCIWTFKQHNKPVNTVNWSLDNRHLVTGSWDGIIKIFDTFERTEIRSIMNDDIKKSIRSVSYSPSDKYIVSGSMDQQVVIWDPKAGKQITTLSNHLSSVTNVNYSMEGQHLLSAGEDGLVKVFDAVLGKQINQITIQDCWMTYISSNDKGDLIVTATNEGQIKLWTIDLVEIHTFTEGHNRVVNCVEFRPVTGNLMASCSDDQSIIIWNVIDKKIEKVIKGHRDIVNQVKWNPINSNLICSASDDFTIRIWDIMTGDEIAQLNGHTSVVKCCSYSPNGKYIASGGRDCNVLLFNANTYKLLATYSGHRDWINTINWSKDSSKIVSGSWDYTLKVWNVKQGKEKVSLEGHASAIGHCTFTNDDKLIITGSFDGSLKVFDAKAGSEITTLIGHERRVSSFTITNDGTVISVSDDQTIRTWDSLAGIELTTIPAHTDTITSSFFYPNSQTQLVTASNDNSCKLWDVTVLDKDIIGHSKPIYSIQFSNDGNLLATASKDKTIKIWNSTTSKLQRTLRGHNDTIRCISISNDNTLLASGSDDKQCIIYNINNGTIRTILKGHTNSVQSVAFSPKGNEVTTASYDKTIRTWNINTGQCIKVMNGHSDWITTVQYTPDGQYIISGSLDNNCIIWRNGVVHKKITCNDWISSLSVSPDSTTLFCGYYNGKSEAFTIQSGTKQFELNGHEKRVTATLYSSNQRAMLTCSLDGSLKIWNTKSQKLVAEFPTSSSCTAAAMSVNNQIAVSDLTGKIYLLALAFAKNA